MPLAVRLRRRLGTRRKTRNCLLLVVLIDFEFILRQVANVVAFLVDHYSVDQHQLRFLLDGHGRLLRGSSRRGWRWDRLRSEEHTSELQSHHDLVCRLLLEKKKKNKNKNQK